MHPELGTYTSTNVTSFQPNLSNLAIMCPERMLLTLNLHVSMNTCMTDSSTFFSHPIFSWITASMQIRPKLLQVSCKIEFKKYQSYLVFFRPAKILNIARNSLIQVIQITVHLLARTMVDRKRPSAAMEQLVIGRLYFFQTWLFNVCVFTCRTNPDHWEKYAHPGGSSRATPAPIRRAQPEKERCRYGDSCSKCVSFLPTFHSLLFIRTIF